MKRHTVVRSTLSLRGILPLLVTSLLLAGCGGSVNLRTEAQVPEPLVPEIPLRLGVHFDEEFRNYVYQEDTEDRPEWRIDNSDSRLALFEQVLSSMFREARPVASIDAGADAGVDAVIAPEVEEMQLALPRETYSELYEAWIKYNIRLYTPEGELITEWRVTGYGKSIKGFMTGSDRGLSTAIAMALRDIGAKLALGFPKAAPVKQWLASRGGACTETAALSC